MQTAQQAPRLTQLAPLLATVAAAMGAGASASVLSGDSLGRVNLLFSLILFTLLPAASILVTAVLMLFGRRGGVASLLVSLRLIPLHTQRSLAGLSPFDSATRAALFTLSQSIALAFGGGVLAGFLLLLLTSDVNFVWRSTLLDAATLFPVLDALALPWRFWESAQPSLAILSASQDFRLGAAPSQETLLGSWWRFLLAAQLCYSLLPRALLLLYARGQQRAAGLNTQTREIGVREESPRSPAPKQELLADTVDAIPAGATLIDWAHTPETLLARIAAQLEAAVTLAREQATSIEEIDSPVVILVRSWEPPLGELADFMSGSGALYIAPIDWREQTLVAPSETHELEWRRFCATREHCAHLLLRDLLEDSVRDSISGNSDE